MQVGRTVHKTVVNAMRLWVTSLFERALSECYLLLLFKALKESIGRFKNTIEEDPYYDIVV